MTFGQYILRIRRRLQDLRTLTGTVITSISEDGARWSSSEIIEIANTALEETPRLLSLYAESPIMQHLSADAFKSTATGTLSSGELAIGSNVISVLAVQNTSENRSFGYAKPSFFSHLKDADYDPREGEYYFTVMYDTGNSTKKIYALPADNDDIEYTYINGKHDYDSGDSAVSLHILGIDGFLLDLAEREARDREHNWERAGILDRRIAIKLGVK